jgi:hypothetical protein
MEIDRSAPAIAEAELPIGASPEVVWDVISDLERWPVWGPDIESVTVEGPITPGTTFRWRSRRMTLTSTLRVVDPPRELGWTGTTMGIRAVHVFRFEPRDGGTLARSEESWAGFLPKLLKGYSRRTIGSGIRSWLARLKAEAERRAGT